MHRPLYDWILENLDLPRPLPHQYEFARLSLGYTIMSKRKLMQLVEEKLVTGWDDPRMPTISGIRRRGVTRRPCGTSPTTSASRNTTASPTSPFWNTPSATT